MPQQESRYLFTSERLGFREWKLADLDRFHELNSCARVMEHFPSPLSKAESAEFINRLIAHQNKHGYCYYACELLQNHQFIGFVGLAYQNYQSPYTPATDIGWRLLPEFWNKGYATEGALRCLKYAFEDSKLQRVIATCTISNNTSERVMRKIGMSKIGEFEHPKLAGVGANPMCSAFEIQRPENH